MGKTIKRAAIAVLAAALLFWLANCVTVLLLHGGALDVLEQGSSTSRKAATTHFLWPGFLSWLKSCFLVGAIIGFLSWLTAELFDCVTSKSCFVIGAVFTFMVTLRGVLTYPAIVEAPARKFCLGTMFDLALDYIPPAAVELLLLLFLFGLSFRLLFLLFKRSNSKAHKVAMVLVFPILLCTFAFTHWIGNTELPKTKGTIVIVVESLRSDHLHCTGYDRKVTPNLDDLAKQGLLMPNVFVPLARTQVAVTSLLTGCYPHRHGIRHLFPHRANKRLRCPLLPRILRKKGIVTSALGDFSTACLRPVDMEFTEEDIAPAVTVGAVLERELYLRSPICSAFLLGSGLATKLPAFRLMPLFSDPRLVAQKVKCKISELARREKPYFLFVILSGTHVPFAAPTPYWRHFSPKRGRPFRYAFGPIRFPDVAKMAEKAYSPPEQKRLIDLYDSALFAVDEAIGEITSHINKSGLENETSLFVLGDHGTDLFDGDTTMLHGDWFRGGVQSYRVPLIAKVPGRTRANTRSVVPRSSIDLAPTILSILRIDDYGQMDGKSFADKLGSPQELTHRPIFAETGIWMSSKSLFTENEVCHYPDALSLLLLDPESGAPFLAPAWEDQIVRSKLRMIVSGTKRLIYRPTPTGYVMDNPLNIPGDEKEKLKNQLLQWISTDPARAFDDKNHLVRK